MNRRLMVDGIIYRVSWLLWAFDRGALCSRCHRPARWQILELREPYDDGDDPGATHPAMQRVTVGHACSSACAGGVVLARSGSPPGGRVIVSSRKSGGVVSLDVAEPLSLGL